jgi:hypothetical protein
MLASQGVFPRDRSEIKFRTNNVFNITEVGEFVEIFSGTTKVAAFNAAQSEHRSRAWIWKNIESGG